MNSRMKNILKYSIFPRHCEICGEVVPIMQPICDECKSVKRIDGKVCTKCGNEKSDCTCSKSHHTPEYKCIVAPFKYDDRVRRAIYNLKFYSQPELAHPMGVQIANTVKMRYSSINFDIVTCIPITKRRRNKRGYNQTELLAKVVAKELDVPFEYTLSKLFETKPQRQTKAKYRRGNVFGVYDIKENVDIADKTILIIDDVKTTGATISHCSSILKMYGSGDVYAAVFAIK